MKKCILFLLALPLILASCEKDADVKLPSVPPKLAVFAFLNSLEAVEVTVTRVSPLYGTVSGGPEYVSNAQVYISNGQDTVPLTFDPVYSSYRNNTTGSYIQPGKTYWVWASAAGYPLAKGFCTVPLEKIDTQEVDVEYRQFPVSGMWGGDTSATVVVKWRDIPAKDNYYRVMAELMSVYDNGGNDVSEFYFYPGNISDQKNDGKILSALSSETSINSFGTLSSREVIVYLVNGDENYYRYHRSVENYAGENPFGEPSQLYSNVQGGSGVICGFTSINKTIRIY